MTHPICEGFFIHYIMEKEITLLEKEVILPPKETIEVYNIGNSKKPHYIVTEKTARRELSTHKECEKCGKIVRKNYYCSLCHNKLETERYFKKPFKEWDGKTPLVIHNSDEYFFNIDDLEQYIEENENDDFRLVICSPNFCNKVDEEYFCEEMPDCFDNLSYFDKVLVQKIEELNKYIDSLKPMSWSQGGFRTEYKPK